MLEAFEDFISAVAMLILYILVLALIVILFKIAWAYAISQVFGLPELTTYQAIAWLFLIELVTDRGK